MRRTLQAGDVLSDRYRIERELGRGAMGVVYRARDVRHGRDVAVKVLNPETLSAAGGARFRDEIRTAAQLNHPSILAVHDSGEVDGLLYYVTPVVEGESLRDRLGREGSLPLEEALRLTRLLANALSYAHASGIVHRDVKPENILLDRNGHPLLADFGVARSVRVEEDGRRTRAGAAVGSPLYMSPEQAVGERDVDGRSDVYSLALVLYEMLAGERAYTGDSPQAVLSRQLTGGPPSLRQRRADVPPHVDAAVSRGLARDPAERWPTVGAFASALSGAASPPTWGWARPWLRPAATLGAVSVVLAVLALVTKGPGPLVGGPDLDTLRYAVLPFRVEGGVAASLGVDLLMHDALGRWREVEMVDRLQVADAMAREGAGPDLTTAQALDVARRLRSGRYVHGMVAAVRDSIRVDVILYDARRGARPLSQASLSVSASGETLEEGMALLADSLLFGRWGGGSLLPAGGTNSVAARRAYGRGHETLAGWDLARADSLFRAATRHDPHFALAHLWVAQVGDWEGESAERWSHHAQQALRSVEVLPPRERLLAEGLAALAARRFPDACRAYAALEARDPSDFAAWYGLGQCRAGDHLVVPDPGSPSGYSFRASYHQAVEAYRRAFKELPSTHRAFRSGTFERVREILLTSVDQLVSGSTASRRGGPFLGWPVWQGDTLALIPYPLDAAGPLPEKHASALLRQRQVFQDIARTWALAFPDSPDALYAVAVSLEMLGDPAALDTLQRARSLVPSGERSLAMGASEVWLRVKLGTPDRIEELDRARHLADSLLASVEAPSAEEAILLSSLAALRGRATESARLARLAAQPLDALVRIPASIMAAAGALESFAAVGGPLDSIIALEEEVEAMIRQAVPAAERSAVRALLLEMPAILAFPGHLSPSLRDPEHQRAGASRAQALWSAGDAPAARAVLEAELARRKSDHPEDVSIDVAFAEARLLALMGDTAAAVARLDPILGALRWTQPGVLAEPARSGALMRAMALRAELARARGDATDAGRWAAAVAALRGRHDM